MFMFMHLHRASWHSAATALLPRL